MMTEDTPQTAQRVHVSTKVTRASPASAASRPSAPRPAPAAARLSPVAKIAAI